MRYSQLLFCLLLHSQHHSLLKELHTSDLKPCGKSIGEKRLSSSHQWYGDYSSQKLEHDIPLLSERFLSSIVFFNWESNYKNGCYCSLGNYLSSRLHCLNSQGLLALSYWWHLSSRWLYIRIFNGFVSSRAETSDEIWRDSSSPSPWYLLKLSSIGGTGPTQTAGEIIPLSIGFVITFLFWKNHYLFRETNYEKVTLNLSVDVSDNSIPMEWLGFWNLYFS